MAKTKNADGTETTEGKTQRVVYVGEPSPADANRSISTQVHPALYDAFVARVAAVKGSGTVNGKTVLTDGSMALSIREALASWAQYEYKDETDLVLKKQKESNKLVNARNLVKALFTGLRAKMDYDSSLPMAKLTIGALGVQLTEQEYADLWDEAAAS